MLLNATSADPEMAGRKPEKGRNQANQVGS